MGIRLPEAATIFDFIRKLFKAAPGSTATVEQRSDAPRVAWQAGVPEDEPVSPFDDPELAAAADDEDDPEVGEARPHYRTIHVRPTKDTNYLPRTGGAMLTRTGDPALKYAQLGAQLIRAVGESSKELFDDALGKMLRRARAFRAIADRIAVIALTVSKIQKAILTKDYSYAAQMASTLAQDASLLTDDVVLMATAIVRSADSLEGAFGANDLMAASRQIQSLVTMAEQFDQKASSRADNLMQLVSRLDRAVKTRDFALITSLAGILARDATVVAAFVDEDAPSSASQMPPEPDLEAMMALIGEMMATRQFTALATGARLMLYRAGLFSDPVMAQAVQLNQLARQLRQALLEGKRDVALALAGNIARSAGIFRAPVLERTNNLLDQCLQLEQAGQHKDYAAISNLAARVARTADLLTNGEVSRASSLVQQSSKVEQAIRRFDLAAASGTLDSLQAK
ncbi:MAG: hypothetical protein FJZ01_16380 [Candidatus Sericytochromatia bacterium]|nr:hypothetical protein [Candidatus Tanganyikabacteria bacterium]